MTVPAAALAVLPAQTDTLDGSADNWSNGGQHGGGIVPIGTGGPAGSSDGYLQVSSGNFGGATTPPKLVTFNRAQWTGNYSAAGVTGVSMALKNFGSASVPIRIAIREGTGGSSTPGWCSTAYTLAADGQWHTCTFALDATMTEINSPQPLATDLAAVAELRILSSAAAALTGDSITAQIGIADITAVGAAPSISGQPQSQTVVAGGSVTFSVTASGTPAPTYQWHKNGANLSNGGNVSGATTATLALNNVQSGDAGSYDVVVSNPYGSTTSQQAVLSPGLPPSITADPQSQTVLAGAFVNVTFNVTASGTGTLNYQWRKNHASLSNGGNVSGATTATLALNNVQTSDAGSYDVMVSSPYGSATSHQAILAVNPLNTLTVTSTQGGLVNPGPSGYAPGAQAVLTAMPYPGWTFNGWSGDASGSANPLTMTMDSPKSVQANFVNPGIACADVLSSITDWWPFDGNLKDLIGGADTSNPSAGYAYTAGKVGQALSFNGSESIDLSAVAGNFGTAPFSIEFWINIPASVTRPEEVLSKRHQCSTTDIFWDIYTFNGILTLEMNDASGAYAIMTLNKAVNDGAWHHVVFARDGRVLYAYLDGTLNTTLDPGSTTSLYPAGHLIAGSGPCAGSSRFQFSGALDELTLYNSALSLQQVAAIYSNGKCRGVVAAPLPGLVAWWPGENPPALANDLIGANNGPAAAWRQGKVGKSFDFSLDPAINILDVPAMFHTAMAIEAWVWPEGNPSAYIIRKTAINGPGSYALSCGGNGGPGSVELEVWGYDTQSQSAYREVYTPASVLPPNTWSHIVATFDGTTESAKIYVNGQQALTSLYTSPSLSGIVSTINDAQGTVVLGDNSLGGLDEVALYGGALSYDEVMALYSIGGPAGKAAISPLSISMPLAGQTVPAGGSVTFSAGVTGFPLYQWRVNGADIPGATSSSLTLANVQCTSAGAYTVVAYNGFFPSVTNGPANLTVTGQATLTVTTNGGGAVVYAPSLACYPVGGTVTLQAAPAAGWNFAGWSGGASGLATYLAVVLNANTSITATFTSNVPDIIVDNSDPGAGFSPGWSYGTASPGYAGPDLDYRYSTQSGISAEFTTSSLQTGNYDVDVIFPLSGNGQSSVPYSVGGIAGASGPASVLLSQNGTGGSWLHLLQAQPFQQGGNAIVSLANGSDPAPATTFADAVRWRWAVQQPMPPFITQPPKDQFLVAGGTATFSVFALGDGLLRYQWFTNGVQVPAQTSTTLTLTNVTANEDGLSCSVQVTGSAGSASAAAILHIGTAPTIPPGQPQNVFVGLGQSAGFSVSASGSTPLSYQWNSNNIVVAGAAGPSFTVNNVQASAHLSSYFVVVTNLFGAYTSSVATLSITGAVPVILAQPQGLAVPAGGNATLSVQAVSPNPLNYQWRLNGIAIPGATDSTYTRTNLDPGGKVMVGSASGSLPSLVRLGTNGSTDGVFTGDPSDEVSALAFQADGKLLVGAYTAPQLTRLNRDGSLDGTFSPQIDGGVDTLALQANGQILVGGTFQNLGGQPHSYLGRLRLDGSADNSFSPQVSGEVLTLAVQADGKILAGIQTGATSAEPLVRLNADGTRDTAFKPSAGPQQNYAFVWSLALDRNARILVGGSLTLNGTSTNFARLNPDGSTDTGFNCNGEPEALAVQGDGKILLGGPFTAIGGQDRYTIGRIYSNGNLDLTFAPVLQGQTLIPPVQALALQPDGRILVAGQFSSADGLSRTNIARLNTDGTVDSSFNANTPSPLDVVLLQPSDFGNYTVVVGDFSTTITSAVAQVSQLLPPTIASTSSGVGDNASDPAYSSSWSSGQNGGTGFGPWSLVTYGGGSGGFFVGDSSVNGSGASSNINTMGNKAWGIYAGSGEQSQANRRLNPPLISGQTLKLDMDAGHINSGLVEIILENDSGSYLQFYNFAGDAHYTVVDSSGQRDSGVAVTDGPLHLELTLTTLGAYSATCTTNGNLAGRFTGTLAGDGTIDSFQLVTEGTGATPPSGIFFNSLQITTPVVQLGAFTSLSVTTGGGAPTSYQWQLNGAPIAGATGSLYTVPSAQASDAGTYSLVLSNAAGSITNLVTTLSVLTDNSWLNPSNGKWEDASSWLTGAPSSAQTSVNITNAQAKTVTIDATTSGSSPNTMTVQNLTVDGPVNGITNTLWLDYAGESLPLTVQGQLVVGPNGLVRIQGSALVANGQTYVDGTIPIPGSSLTCRSLLQVGTRSNATPQLIVTGGKLDAAEMVMGPTTSGAFLQVSSNAVVSISGANSRLAAERIMQDGGTIEAFDATVALGSGRNSAYSMSGGVLVAKELAIGADASGHMTNSGGIILISSNLVVGAQSSGVGTLDVTGGTVVVASSDNSQKARVVIGANGNGQLRLNGGTVAVEDFFATNGAQSAITIQSGTLDCSGSLVVSDTRPLQVGDNVNAASLILGGSSAATVSCANGLVVCTNSSMAVVQGNNAFSGSVLNCGSVSVSSAASAQFADAVTNYGVLAVGNADATVAGPVVNYGTLTLGSGGTLSCYAPVVNNGTINAAVGNVQFYSGVQNNGTIVTATGTNRTVVNRLDSGAGSLRGVIGVSGPGDTIGFAGGLTGTITLTSGELAIGTNLTILGPGPKILAVSGSNSSRVFHVTGGTVNLSGLNIANGNTPYGAGLYNQGVTIVSNCVFSANIATGTGGGAFYNDGTMQVLASTICTNLATGGTGGGIYNNTSHVMALTNCTIAANLSYFLGGAGIVNAGPLALAGCTITINASSATNDSGGGIYNYSYGSVQILDSIVAANHTASGNGPDVSGVFSSLGFNLIGQTNASSGWLASDLKGSAGAPLIAQLGPLQDNGGPTYTMALLPDSPALDKGYSFGMTTDQRGRPRPYKNPAIANAPGGDGSDIGTYELNPPALTIARSGTNALLSWSAIEASYVLESSLPLKPPAWKILPAAPAIILGQYVLTNGPVTGHEFYRLHLLLASDNASYFDYNSGWNNLANGGFGLGPWGLSTTASSSSGGGFFVYDSSANGSGNSGNINTAGNRAWGLYANGGNSSYAHRAFNPLQIGQTFKLDMDNGYIDSGGSVGFKLLSGATSSFGFFFVGGTSSYSIADGSSNSRNTGIGFTDGGLHLEFTLTGTNSYSVAITPGGGTTTLITGILAAAAAIDNVQFYNSDAGSGSSHDLYFNSLQIFP